jgi:predicted naringenin-chalcone synthase
VSYLLCIETANPKHLHKQNDFTEFYCNSVSHDETAERKIKVIANKSSIKERYSVIPDFSLKAQDFTFFEKNKSLEPSPLLSKRMAIYNKEALQLSLQAIHKIEGINELKEKITHIITVTCTGLFAPGLDIELINALKLKPNTNRSSINFMGCNAAVLALKQAHQICNSTPNSVVLIVCTELCTIHFQKNYSDDYILSNLLFADGSAAAIVSSNNISINKKYTPLKLNSFHSLIIEEGLKEMAWQVTETGFIMNLTSYVSPLLKKHLPNLLDHLHINKSDIQHWAVHPGGKRILDDFCSTLSLNESDLKDSYQTLENYGNMSSPTILFVLKNLLQNNQIKKEETIYAVAFGPGLSIESVLLKHV